MRKFGVHLGFWLVFFLMWNRLLYFYVNNEWNRLYFSALDTGLILLTFYALYAYLMPDYFRRRNLGRLIILSGLVGLLLAGLAAWIMGLLLQNMIVPIHFDFSWTYKDMQYNRLFMTLLGILAGIFVRLALDRFELRRSLVAMEKERSAAELTYLKAQLNPHFLFNSLNSLYSQLELGTGDPKQTLSALADMLRYQLYDSGQDLASLNKELAYLADYIALQKLRMDNCEVNYKVAGNIENLEIAPLLLISFVENAFKHVSDNLIENFIDIHVLINESQLDFTCRNSYETSTTGKGIGLYNVRKRLSLIYGERQQLMIKEDNNIYEVSLSICLKS
ncbi:histidine kinase [Mucilaginibacter rigui]|uniref:Histidine kinase n=1 Tax=Mucilaginibacter rigui TaxID=534635 RepID=A0ABR7X270_9SPHI|nr:histidine kinase [Mucilaginibacter rigui]MBD1384616.1 histidine kinase [Mucilaginibacter rigui]